MENQFELLYSKLKIEMQKQTLELTNNIMEKIDEKIKPVLEENKKLRNELVKLEKKVEYMERDKKFNNIIIYGMKEEEESTLELFTKVKECFLQELEINVEEWEINKIHRIGNIQKSGKQRPVLLSFVSGWKKREIMENKKKLKNIYIAEDYSKETLEKRKALQPQLIEERKKGNFAIIKYDKLIVKRNTIKEKRKRQTPTPPETDAQPRKQKTLNTLSNKRINAFDKMKGRSLSFTGNLDAEEQ
ncbi:uncharacterized protein LOC123659685 [Melitaea cinxia]|uniref:uncharacterized protein LOC123659640 n=1 Tax=Melitaea cinxia TaxID=113334 RepID=UPI001E26F72E|nr:uncharacterized protein LOC123659640 [Melitaea cinxia]XP_045450830.1 uncharacterized protein LOC123659685 [Melitaea cinxia]